MAPGSGDNSEGGATQDTPLHNLFKVLFLVSFNVYMAFFSDLAFAFSSD